MTPIELQDIVRRLANQGYCRYWLNWPVAPNKRHMAISLLEVDNYDHAHFKECPELEALGFTRELYNGSPIYRVERTD